jgi:predicted transcriptional regulator
MLASQLKKGLEKKLKHAASSTLAKDDKLMIQFVQSVEHLIESQKTEYLGKVNFNYVKSMAKQRAQTLNDTLELLLENFPTSIESASATVRATAQIVETFFLTDHVEENEDGDPTPRLSAESISFRLPNPVTPLKTLLKFGKRTSDDMTEANETTDPSKVDATTITSPVIPITRKARRSIHVRALDHEMLAKVGEGANLLLDEDTRTESKLVPSYSKPVPTVHFAEGNVLGNLIENNPYVFLAIFVASAVGLKLSSYLSVTVDFDIALLLGFALFCVGLHMPRPSQSGIDTPAAMPKPIVTFAAATTPKSASFMIRRSLLVSPKMASLDDDGMGIMTESEHSEGKEDPLTKSPLDIFPAGAKLGSHLNCWSMPVHNSFHVRGANYIVDRKKVESGEFLFPTRGVDLFLTDACPENVGSNSGMMGGALREKPTLIINFRLPWGVFISYFEIPERFLPFVRKRYEYDFDGTVPDVSKMTASERCVCRFLESDQETKNKTLKIVPVVVEGPWIVKSVVGGKPAIIGNKLPVNWVYEKATNGKAMYLEADLDIVSSSAARGILSVARSHTQVLTLDLGFVVQGNTPEELPEQMMVGVRLHGIDPCTASPLPPMKNHFMQQVDDDSSWISGA